MKHLNLELEKLEQRIAPGGIGVGGISLGIGAGAGAGAGGGAGGGAGSGEGSAEGSHGTHGSHEDEG